MIRKNKYPFVSIVTPNYNGEKYLEETLIKFTFIFFTKKFRLSTSKGVAINSNFFL